MFRLVKACAIFAVEAAVTENELDAHIASNVDDGSFRLNETTGIVCRETVLNEETRRPTTSLCGVVAVIIISGWGTLRIASRTW